jgi:hypothetical protein
MTSAKPRRSGRLASAARGLGGMLTILALGLSLGCSPDGDPPTPRQAVFIDAVTQQVVVAESSAQYPAIHPETGKATLMPAMHCPRCAAWRRVPTPDQLNQAGQALTCAKCKQPLQLEGPLPGTATNLAVTPP